MLVFDNTNRSFLSQSWKALQQAEVAVPSMTGICTSLAESWAQWQDWRSDASAHRAPLPTGWEEKLNRFQKMIVVRTLAEVSEASTKLLAIQMTGRLLRQVVSHVLVSVSFKDVHGSWSGPRSRLGSIKNTHGSSRLGSGGVRNLTGRSGPAKEVSNIPGRPRPT